MDSNNDMCSDRQQYRADMKAPMLHPIQQS